MFAGRAHLAHHEHALAAELLHFDGHLRIAEIAVAEPVLDDGRHLGQRGAAGFDATEERVAEMPVVLHAVAARELRLVEDRHRQHVFGADHVVGLSVGDGRGRLGSQRGHRQLEHRSEPRERAYVCPQGV